MKLVLTFTIGLAAGLASLSLLAADSAAPSPSPTTRPAGTTAPAAPTTRPQDPEASADAVIQALLESRVKKPVLPKAPSTAPASQRVTVAPRTILQPLPTPPGTMIWNRLGRIVKDRASGWWTFRFESEKNILYEAPMRILPNRQLETMENILDKSGRIHPRFVVSGEVTQYRGKRYLLIRKKLVKREMGAL